MNGFIDSTGRPVSVGQALGKGGEGTVFALQGDEEHVVKVYHNEPSPQTAEKLTAMVALANQQLVGLSAWPTSLIYHCRTRRLAGFAMPRINGCLPIQQLYNPRQRLQRFPHASWGFQVRTARNLAAAFDEVHKAGCLVGDVNERNIQVSAHALVRLVDCDSFQIYANGKHYLCEVGVPHYIPPELQGHSLLGLVRTQNHDRFGLAVLIYQLLFVGRHPYQGRYLASDDPSFEQLIREYRFAQGPFAKSWAMAPPPHVPTFVDIPFSLGELFRQSFERGSQSDCRPKPSSWLSELEQLERSLTKCSVDSGHIHWQGAKSCTWCRLARDGGPEYYYGSGLPPAGFTVDETRLNEILARLALVEQTSFVLSRHDYFPRVPIKGGSVSDRLYKLRQAALHETERARLVESHVESQQFADQELLRARLEEVESVLKQEFGPRMQCVEADLKAANLAVAEEPRRHEIIEAALLGPAAVGICIFPFGMLHWIFAVIGGGIACGFALAFARYFYSESRNSVESRLTELLLERDAIHVEYSTRLKEAMCSVTMEVDVRSSSRRATLDGVRRSAEFAKSVLQKEFYGEVEPVRRSIRLAENRMQAREHQYRVTVDAYVRERDAYRRRIQELITQCRSLAGDFAIECRRLSENAEAAARMRHLRLYSIIDAEIPGIGFGRKQILADHSIATAADVDEDRIRQISGFGESLTCRILEWKAGVLRQFTFAPGQISGSSEMRALAARFHEHQNLIHTVLAPQVEAMETLRGKCCETTESLMWSLRRAALEYEEARATERNLLAAVVDLCGVI